MHQSYSSNKIEKFDSKIVEELNDLRNCMKQLKEERDKVLIQMRSSEEKADQEQKNSQEMVEFIKMQEKKNKDFQQSSSEAIEILNEKLKQALNELNSNEKTNSNSQVF